MIILTACGTGFLLDLLFGDPAWIYHPVRIIGNGIALGERLLRKRCGQDKRRLAAAGEIRKVMIGSRTYYSPEELRAFTQKEGPLC